MKTVHAGLAIANAAFDALLEDLGAVLDARQVTAADRAALLARSSRCAPTSSPASAPAQHRVSDGDGDGADRRAWARSRTAA